MNAYGESGGWHEAHASPANAAFHEAVRRLVSAADDCSKSRVWMAALFLHIQSSANQHVLYNDVFFALSTTGGTLPPATAHYSLPLKERYHACRSLLSTPMTRTR